MYCPKGTSVTLSPQDRIFIQSELSRKAQDTFCTLKNPTEHQLHTLLETLVRQFQDSCKLISNETVLRDSVNNQEFILSPSGLVHVTRVIYAQALFWTQVFDIKAIYPEDKQEHLTKIQIWYYEKENRLVNCLVIDGSISKDSSLCLLAFLFVIKNIFLEIINFNTQTGSQEPKGNKSESENVVHRNII